MTGLRIFQHTKGAPVTEWLRVGFERTVLRCFVNRLPSSSRPIHQGSICLHRPKSKVRRFFYVDLRRSCQQISQLVGDSAS